MKGSDLRSYSTYRWIMSAPDLPAKQAQRTPGAVARRNGTRRSGARQTLGGSVPGTPLPVRASVIRHLPYPGLFIALVGSLGGLFVLAVVGAYDLIRTVLG